jgi:hypothetical protein
VSGLVIEELSRGWLWAGWCGVIIRFKKKKKKGRKVLSHETCGFPPKDPEKEPRLDWLTA